MAIEEPARVLITVKAYPNPSHSYGETVCVAGVRLDTVKPEWVRLYPVAFRDLALGDRFKKYQLVDLRLSKAKDGRPESHRPNLASLKLGEVVPSKGTWRDRWPYLEDLAGATTTCELYRRSREPGAPSLGLVKVAKIVDLIIEPNEDFRADQQAAAQMAAAEDLFGNQHSALEPSPVKLKYKYFCDADDCKSHTQTNIDWEVGQSARKWGWKQDPERVTAMLRQTYLNEMFAPDRETYFYLGNQAKRRQTFAVLGVFWPRIGARPEPSLF